MAVSDIQPSPNAPTLPSRWGWLVLPQRDRPGHSISFAGLVLFTLLLYFRPQDYFPALDRGQLVAAALTAMWFVPTQYLLEGRLSARPPELKFLLWLTLLALISIPIATNRSDAWETFSTQFIKIVAMFIVMINVVRTESRWKWLFWVALAAGLQLAGTAINDWRTGQTPLEGYRVRGAQGGMFADPNDMALFFVTIMPITLALLLGTRSAWAKMFYAACIFILVGGMIFTYSRGGFIGFAFMYAVLAYKLGRGRRLLVGSLSVLAFIAFIVLAPGNYAMRLASITDTSRDVTGSAGERQQLLFTSLEVTAKNPLFGVGMNNFYHYTERGKPTHNAFTQVSSELGLPALGVYLAFILVPFLHLRRMENETVGVPSHRHLYYLSVGLQASLVGFMASSFFLSVAYYWIVYYLVGYAVCLRRIYETGAGRVLGRVIPAEDVADLEKPLPAGQIA
jgi:O-antigen ligase